MNRRHFLGFVFTTVLAFADEKKEEKKKDKDKKETTETPKPEKDEGHYNGNGDLCMYGWCNNRRDGSVYKDKGPK